MTSFFTPHQSSSPTTAATDQFDLLNGFEHLPEPESALSSLSPGLFGHSPLGLASTPNGGLSLDMPVSTPPAQDAIAAVQSIKTALAATKMLEKADLKEQVQYLEDLVQNFFDVDDQGNPGHTNQSQLKALRQVMLQITQQMRQASGIEAIARVLLDQMLSVLKGDRAILYRFDSALQGTVLMESLSAGWTPAQGDVVVAQWFGLNNRADYAASEGSIIHDVQQQRLTPFQSQLLEHYQVKASLACPVWLGYTVWGLVVVHQCSAPRHWDEVEISLVQQLTHQFSLMLQPAYWRLESQKQADGERLSSKVVERIFNAVDLQTLFNTTVKEVRRFLQADRVGVFQFYPYSGYDDGEFVSEDVQSGYTSAIAQRIHDHCFGTQYADKYKDGQIQAVSDIYNAGLSDCHIDVLSKYEVRANLIVPLLKNQQLWGLLCIHQCSGSRQWRETEIDFVKRIAAQFSVALQQVEYTTQLSKIVEREQAVAKVVNKLRQTLDMQTIFNTVTQEVRKLLKVERLTIYKFREDYFGDFITESVSGDWPKLVGSGWEDPYLNEHQGGRFRDNLPLVVDDIHIGETLWEHGHLLQQAPKRPLTDCHIEALEYYQVQACAVVSIFQGDKLWGLLSAFQNTSTRHWQEEEVTLMMRIAAQVGIAIQQSDYATQLAKTLEREQLLSRLTNKVRQTTVLETILNSTTQETRRLMNVERIAIYQFRPDYYGDIVAEAKAGDWPSLVGAAWEDPYLQEHQGGRFKQNDVLVAEDIYTAELTDCHIEALESFGVRACAVVSIFQGQKLWGLLSAFQHSGPYPWEDGEVKLLTQVATQIGLALQQHEYLQQLKQQAEEGAQAIAREKEDKERIQTNVVQLLRAVRPALQGDLTVRAPVTEDEVGTVADAYNNTIQSLRQIVSQVQAAAIKVGQTSQDKGTAITELSKQVQQELQEITQALQYIEGMVNTSTVVATSAQQVEAAVQQANDMVRTGDVAMNRTVDGILGIRETVSETSKKIKRLSESSQKISKVVNLIGNFTTQTQLLALNAAIEATRAGEYGRGFAVVADEVRSLARQSADATIEIEKLVQEIQTETTAVAAAMDVGIDQVVNGTTLVNETRQNLNAIVMATDQISQLVQGITQATQSQAQQAQTVTQAMNNVSAIADKTSTDTQSVALSFQELLETAQELQASVGQFKVQ